MSLSWNKQEADDFVSRRVAQNSPAGSAFQRPGQSPQNYPPTSPSQSGLRAPGLQPSPPSHAYQSSFAQMTDMGSAQPGATSLPLRRDHPNMPVVNDAPSWNFDPPERMPLTPVTNSPPRGLNSSPSVNGANTPSTSSDISRGVGLPMNMDSLGKRRRELASEFLDDHRSKRATPEPTTQVVAPAMSRQSSDDFPDELKELFGSDMREDMRSFKQVQREQEEIIKREKERKERQEAEDAEFARILSEQWNGTSVTPFSNSASQPQKSYSVQSKFAPNGKVRRPTPPPVQIAPVKAEYASNPGVGPSNARSSYTAPSQPPRVNAEFQPLADDDDDLLYVGSKPVHHPGRTLPWPSGSQASSSTGIPTVDLTSNGLYGDSTSSRNNSIVNPYASNTMMPGFQSMSAYPGAGGQSVYNTTMNSLGYNGMGMPGAYNNPLTFEDMAGYGSTPRRFGDSSGFMNTAASLFNGMGSLLQTPRMPWGVDNDDYSDDDAGFGYSTTNTYNDPDNSEALKDLLNNIRPDEEENLGSDERGDGTPEGMADTANLYKYQAKGVAWLAKMEEGTNKGSILADDMGLGKTIQAIALMVSRPSTEPRCKTNLIVAPVALIRQWESEIATKIRPSHKLSTYIYHGTSAEKRKATFEYLAKYDVVITTYGALQTDSKKLAKLTKLRRENPNHTIKDTEKPVLVGQGCKWYRCILDEAQNIKNKIAKTSQAAHELQSVYRLVMTGTPMMNNIVELYSLIKFLRIQPYCQWEKFNSDFVRPLKSPHSRDFAMRKVQALLKAIMMRRTKKSQMDGKPLIVLPERQMNVANAVFEEDEKSFYQALENKTQIQFNKFVKAGTVGKHYSNILTLLLRLRQAACHPHLIKDFAVAVDATPEDLLEAARSLPAETVQRLIDGGITECPVCMDAAENYTIFHPCGHNTCPECFCRLSDSAQNQAAANDGSGKAPFNCHSCRANIDPKKTTDYVHFKMIHMPELAAAEGLADIDEPASDDDSEDDSDDSDSDVEDDDDNEDADQNGNLKDFVVDDNAPAEEAETDDESGDDLNDVKPARTNAKSGKAKEDKRKAKKEPADEDDDDDESDIFVPYEPGYNNGSNPFEKANGKKLKKLKSKDKKGKGKGKEKKKDKTRKTLAVLKKEAMRSKKSRKAYMKRLGKDFVPSAKTNKTMEILQNIQDSTEGEKTIVFSQFTSLLDLMEIPINRRGWNYTRFDGSMNAIDRNNSVQLFTKDPRYKIMLVSLKAGNAGLNLTAASQVVILDPFWNPYIEEQAIDRAHRIGQRRTVQIHRVLVEETVEDRILAMQDKKRALIENALDEGAAQNIGRLDVRQLAYLFGVSS